MPHLAMPTRAGLVVLGLMPLLWPATTPAQPPTPNPVRSAPEGLDFANSLYRSRRYDLAAEEYERFLRSAKPGPDVADAWFGLGNARLFLLKYKEARQAFESFVGFAPDHPNAPTGRYRIGETSYVLGDLAEARRSLEAYVAPAVSPGERRYAQAAWSHLGEIASRQGDLAFARRAYENALKGDPRGSLADRARLGLGRTLAAMGEPAAAVALWKDLAAKGGPEWADKAWAEVARVEAGSGHWAEVVAATEALEKAAPGSPLIAGARIDRAEALAKLGRRDEAIALLRPIAADPSRPLSAQAGDALGALLLASGRPDEALATLDAALARSPAPPLAASIRFRAAESALALGHPDDARGRFAAIADENGPLADDARLRASGLALDAKDSAAARSLAAGIAEASPLRAEARVIEARAELADGRPREAIRILNSVLADNRTGPDATRAASYYLGLAYGKAGQPEKAAEVLAGLAKGPSGADARFLLGQADFEAGRFAEAVASLEAYLAEKPGGDVADHALARIALAHDALGRADEAESALDRLASGFPASPVLPPTRAKLAGSAMLAGRFDRAADLIRPATDGPPSPSRSSALATLGWALLKGGHPAEANAAFDAWLAATPDDPRGPDAFARARTLAEIGRAEAALAAYRAAIEAQPQSNQAGPAALAMARLRVAAGQPDGAAEALARVARDYPTSSGEPLDAVLADWGWALVDAGKVPEADAVFARLLDEFPASPRADDARSNLAESAFAARDYARVLALLGPIVAEGSTARPELVQSALYRVGRARAARREWPAATATFARLLADFPDGPFRREARFWKAEVAFGSGDSKGAEADFAALAAEPPAESDPKGLVSTARARRVQCLVQLGRWADALLAADAAKVDPGDPLAAEVDYGRGRALQGLARFDEAREAFDRAIAARRGTELAARAQLMRGETYFHQESYRDALREFYRVALQYNAPEWQAAALLEAGKVREKLGQWPEAAEEYEKLRAQFPTDRVAAEAGRRLEAVRARR